MAVKQENDGQEQSAAVEFGLPPEFARLESLVNELAGHMHGLLPKSSETEVGSIPEALSLTSLNEAFGVADILRVFKATPELPDKDPDENLPGGWIKRTVKDSILRIYLQNAYSDDPNFSSHYLVQYYPAPATATTAQAQQPPPQPTPSMDAIKALFNDKNLVFGDKNSKNLIVEVADPSCPYCHVAGGQDPELNEQMGSQFKLSTAGGSYEAPVPKIKELVDQGKAAFVWIYFPGHGNGEMGTKAFYCAQEQGKFWEVHNLIMNNKGYDLLNTTVKNDKTKSQEIADFLSGVVDANQLKNCIDSGKYDAKLTEDTNVATQLGVNGTPGFFINNTPFTGAYSWKDMQSAVK